MYTVFNVADWFLKNVQEITNKKLQKLVYYAYAWHLVICNDSVEVLDSRLFPNEFEAWVHGAVAPSLYDKYKVYGSGIIPVPTNVVLPHFSADELDVLKQVVEVYGAYNGNELESINHQEYPWRHARQNLSQYEPSQNRITDEDIYTYYVARLSNEQES